jgi:hypothetical protein
MLRDSFDYYELPVISSLFITRPQSQTKISAFATSFHIFPFCYSSLIISGSLSQAIMSSEDRERSAQVPSSSGPNIPLPVAEPSNAMHSSAGPPSVAPFPAPHYLIYPGQFVMASPSSSSETVEVPKINDNKQVLEYLSKKGYSRTEAMLRRESANVDAEGRPINNKPEDSLGAQYTKAFREYIGVGYNCIAKYTQISFAIGSKMDSRSTRWAFL